MHFVSKKIEASRYKTAKLRAGQSGASYVERDLFSSESLKNICTLKSLKKLGT